MNRRDAVAFGCLQCTLLALTARRAMAEVGANWTAPSRFAEPDPASDEGGLWAMMSREEQRIRRSQLLMRDGQLHDYLQTVACKLGGDHCPDIRVYPIRTPWFNASMAPNGMMEVWSGLLLRVDNEAQLAAILGHEIGHYMQRHLLERLKDARSRSAFATFLIPFGLGGALASWAVMASQFSFSRDQEREADRIGLILMRRAGYDPREASQVWSNLLAEVAVHPKANVSKSSPLFATHPASAERRETLAQLAGEGGGDTFQAEYLAHVVPLQRDLLEDEIKRAEFDETIVLLDRLVKRSPERSDLLYYRAEAHRLRAQKDDVDLALADLNAAAAMPEPPAEVQRSLGFIHQARGDKPAAREAFGKYLQARPDAGDAAMIQSYVRELGS
jgi:beta-barrel assembly-enhancing protease